MNRIIQFKKLDKIKNLHLIQHDNMGFFKSSTRIASNFINKCHLSDIIPHRNDLMEQNSRFKIESSSENDVGIIEFDVPSSKMNFLNMENMKCIYESIEKLSNQQDLKGIIILSKKPDCFISGADIKCLDSIKSVQEGQKLSSEFQNILLKLENFKIPIVAAINGHCLGGGLELAMACTNTVGLNNNSTLIGFPEVLLGLLPGAGGCVRSFNKIRCKDALKMITTGSTINVRKAYNMGYIDVAVQPIGPGIKSAKEASLQLLRNIAIKRIHQLNSSNQGNKPKYINIEKIKYPLTLWITKKLIELKTGGLYPAPYRILQVFKDLLTHSTNITNQYNIESQAFGELAMSKESKNLINLYFKRNKVKNCDYGLPQNPIKSIGIIGSGLMGSGITEVSAVKGRFNVICVDSSEEALISNYNQLGKNLLREVDRKRISKFQKDSIITNTKFTNNIQDIKHCDLVIEAANEDIDTKKKLIALVENVTNPGTIFATNTSALSLQEIMENAQRPQNIIGMHYFSPVPRMELVEIVKHPQLSQESLKLAVDMAKKQGKLCVVVNDCPGFFTTRVLFATLCEIFMLFEEGVSPLKIDEQTLKFGFVYGSASLIDKVGVDVCSNIFDYLHKQYITRFNHTNGNLLRSLVEKGNLGSKTNKGIYTYPSMKNMLKSFQKLIKISKSNVVMYPIISKEYKQLTANQSSPPVINDDDIRMRLICKFINECMLCLEEGIIESPADGDIATIYGLGFPASLGGPFKFVDDFGANNIVNLIDSFNKRFHRPDFYACDLLKDYAISNGKFFN